MTHPTDYSFHPRSESGQGRHTQESGDAGLSSNMEHKFSDNYTDSASPVADKGSFVIPIPKGELHISEKFGKIWSHPSVFGHAAEQSHTQIESHPVCAVEGFLKSSTVLQEKLATPQATPIIAPEENSPEEILPGTTAVTEERPDVAVEGGENCIMGAKMDPGTNADKPKGHPPVSAEKRKASHHKKKAAGKNRKLYLLCWMALIHVPLSEGSADVVKSVCFTCMDKDRCSKLVVIFNSDDETLYRRAPNQILTTCCGVSPPTALKTCAVCRAQSDTINILCSEDVRNVEVEDNDGALNTSLSVCELKHTCDRARFGLIAGAVLFGVVVAALLIRSCCQRHNRTENSQN